MFKKPYKVKTSTTVKASERKGNTIPVTTVREVLKRYAKENSLQNENNPREVILDPILSDCISKRGECASTMTWDKLQDAIVSKMPHAYQIEFENKEPIVKKGKLEPINVTIDTRTGNKKVCFYLHCLSDNINTE
ncbi:unnamed protein product [Larinioides sclopetarius]|uniref:DM2 domain-containing protein n=1 Tax=Larinioides sclopetarius TaxID=280406 RepID=A0AAV2A0P7_9ARAC